MAITRAQQAKQMLQDGGMLVKPGFGGIRQGYRGDDAARSSEGTSGGRADPGNAPQGDGFDRESFQAAQRMGEARQIAKNLAEDKAEERLEKFRNLGSNQRKFQNFLTKISPLAAITSRFGSFNNRDFLVDNVLDAGRFKYKGDVLTREQFVNLSEEEKEDVLDSYLGQRNMGVIDAYGNPIGDRGGDGGINQILPVDTTFAQAPSTTEREPEVEESNDLFRRFRADGGIMNSNVVGGEFDFESARQMYGLGKLVKKIGKTVKKIAKSPIGKAALLYAGGSYLSGMGALRNLPGAGFGSGLLESFSALTPMKKAALIGGGILTAAPFFMKPEEEDEEEQDRGEGLDIARIRANPNQFLARRFVAEGGSMKEPVAKKTMPLLDLDGKEMDLRAEGGFVPIGRMEKADDVPARLSKNEFVFTADAVRNAGDGDVDKGAEVMYNMMKNLESGGDVSKESQGLEGARRMFQTSQRLEEVL